ncbi:MAG: Mannosylfructose-phosphate synthase [Nitrosomonadaceae bacterium]|nr:Mannosylfructose-phosphate synthase [Nitrosomonadaceae bacterium]
MAPYKRVLSLYDAISFRYPESYPWLNNFLHQTYVPRMLPNVDALITGSMSARQDLVHFLPMPVERTHIVQCGIGAQFAPQSQANIEAVMARYGLRQPFILTVSAWQPRKNIEGLLKAFSLLHQQFPEFMLVIAGIPLWSSNDLSEQIRSLGIEDAVVMPGYIAENDLPSLYSAARLFVFPSFYEGFGFPVLEAMACGTPVVCSNTSSLPEVAGDAALQVDPHDAEAIAIAMKRLLDDPQLYIRMREAGFDQAKRFTWGRAAEETVAIYEKVLHAT